MPTWKSTRGHNLPGVQTWVKRDEARLAMSGKRVSPATRSLIAVELRNGDGVTEISRRHGISITPVRRIRREEGLQPLPTAAAKASAGRAREVMALEARRRRGELELAFMGDIEKVRMQLWQPTRVYAFGRNAKGEFGYFEHEIPEPDFKGKQALALVLGILTDKMLALARFDSEGAGMAVAKAAIVSLVDRLVDEEQQLAG
jgi:hypothetical protein